MDAQPLTRAYIEKIGKDLERLKRQVHEHLKQRRIHYYAESLLVPWDQIRNGEGDWCETYPGGPRKPYAHEIQRRMTYPTFEDPIVLLKHAMAKFFVYFAGNRGGKSVWLITWVAMECIGIHPLQNITWQEILDRVSKTINKEEFDKILSSLPQGLDLSKTVRPKPPLHWWIAAPELPSEADIPRGEDAPVLKKLYEWAEADIKNFHRKDKILVWNSGSIINFKGYKQEKSVYKSEDVDGIAWDEEPPRPLWEEGTMRIIDRKGIFLLGMTPDYSSVWSYNLRQREKENTDYVFAPPSGVLNNPFIPADEANRILKGKGEDEKLMRGQGLHVQFKGKVFPFETHIHVGKPFEPDNNCSHYVIIDWHPVKPIVTSFLAIDPRGVWYVWHESVLEDHIVSALAEDILGTITTPKGRLNIRFYVIDQLAQLKIPNEQTRRSESIIQMLRKYDIYCRVGNTNFGSAHAFLCQLMKNKEFYIDESAKLHIEQFDTWGAKRYQRGYLEGTLRDQLATDGNDTCMNMVYAYNAGAKYIPNTSFQHEYSFARPKSVAGIYRQAAFLERDR